MIKERLSGLGMPLIHSGTDYIPEPEVIYQMKQNCRKWTYLASFYLSSLFHVITNCEEGKLLEGNSFGDILGLPGKINVYFWWNIILYKLAFHTSAFISKFSARTFLQTSFYCPPPPPRSKISSYGLAVKYRPGSLANAYRLIRNFVCCFTTWQSLVLQVAENNGFFTIYLFHNPVLMVGLIVHLVQNGASLAIFFAGSKSYLSFLADMFCCIFLQHTAVISSSSSILASLCRKRNMPPCIPSACTPVSYNFILWLLNFKRWLGSVWDETQRKERRKGEY